jgi:predicted TIM-barrel fold metal-dependent hydrolase
MATPPISAALPRGELVSYFAALAEGVDLPVIVQDASSYVGRPIPRDVCVELLDRFGPDRILWGGDWPVVNLGAGLPGWIGMTEDLLAGLSEEERRAIGQGTARRVYSVQGPGLTDR